MTSEVSFVLWSLSKIYLLDHKQNITISYYFTIMSICLVSCLLFVNKTLHYLECLKVHGADAGSQWKRKEMLGLWESVSTFWVDGLCWGSTVSKFHVETIVDSGFLLFPRQRIYMRQRWGCVGEEQVPDRSSFLILMTLAALGLVSLEGRPP